MFGGEGSSLLRVILSYCLQLSFIPIVHRPLFTRRAPIILILPLLHTSCEIPSLVLLKVFLYRSVRIRILLIRMRNFLVSLSMQNAIQLLQANSYTTQALEHDLMLLIQVLKKFVSVHFTVVIIVIFLDRISLNDGLECSNRMLSPILQMTC